MSDDVEHQIPIIRPKWLNITQEPVTHLQEDNSSGLIVAGLADGKVRIIDKNSGNTQREFQAHQMGLLSMSLDVSSHRLATSGEDNSVRIWNTSTGERISEFKGRAWVENCRWVEGSLFFSQGKNLFSWGPVGDDPRLVCSWEHSISDFTLKNASELAVCGYSRLSVFALPSFEEVEKFNWKGQLFKLTFSPNERYAVCASNDLSIHIWDLKRQRDLSMRGFGSKIRDLSFRFDGLYMANSTGPEIVIWDYMDPGPAQKKPVVLGPLEKDVSFLKYQHAGKTLASFGDDGIVVFWRPDLFDDKPLAIAGIRDQAISSALWCRDDQHVVTGLRSGYVALYPAPEVRD
jgi:WD40 repeat protein